MPDFENTWDIPWFMVNKEIENVVIRSGVTRVGVNSFMDCTSVKQVTLPRDLMSIARGAFRDCKGLKTVIFNGQDITELNITERAKLGISYGFQQPPRFKGITVHDLLLLSAGTEKLSKDRCCQFLTKVGLCANDYLDREVDVSLSGGEVKRIEIATILARNSSLMIFDEPEAGIDLWSFARLTETFEQIHRSQDATMIIISHQERIIQLADEIVVVAGGEIAHRGSTEEIFPLILANTLGGCPVLSKEEKK